jgi:hypothetical protein
LLEIKSPPSDSDGRKHWFQAKRQAQYTGLAACFGGVALVISTVGAIAVWLQLEMLREQQRPWIKIISVRPASNLTFLAPDYTAMLTLNFSVRNVGNMPATRVNIGAWPIFYPNDPVLNPNDRIGYWRKIQRRCDGLDDRGMPIGLYDNETGPITVYPSDEPISRDVTVGLFAFQMPVIIRNGSLFIYIIGCVHYESVGRSYTTPIAFRLGHRVETQFGTAEDEGFTPQGSFPMDKLMLNPTPMAVPDAN